MSTRKDKNMFANDVDSDGDEAASTTIGMLAGLMAWFLILKWLNGIVESALHGAKDAADQAGVTIIDSTGKRIAE
jgi:hypothetical protein